MEAIIARPRSVWILKFISSELTLMTNTAIQTKILLKIWKNSGKIAYEDNLLTLASRPSTAVDPLRNFFNALPVYIDYRDLNKKRCQFYNLFECLNLFVVVYSFSLFSIVSFGSHNADTKVSEKFYWMEKVFNFQLRKFFIHFQWHRNIVLVF